MLLSAFFSSSEAAYFYLNPADRRHLAGQGRRGRAVLRLLRRSDRLLTAIASAIDETVRAARAYFTDQSGVRNHVHKIGIFESEADAVSIRMKQSIFSSNLDLARKMMLRDFVNGLDRLADEAEDLGDELSIFVLRRSI